MEYVNWWSVVECVHWWSRSVMECANWWGVVECVLPKDVEVLNQMGYRTS